MSGGENHRKHRRTRSLENADFLTEKQEQSLHECLEVTQKKVYKLEDLIADSNQPAFTKGYIENRFPGPAQFFQRIEYDDGQVDFKADNLKFDIPPKQGNYFYTTLENGQVVTLRQRDRNLFLKNESCEMELEKLVHSM